MTQAPRRAPRHGQLLVPALAALLTSCADDGSTSSSAPPTAGGQGGQSACAGPSCKPCYTDGWCQQERFPGDFYTAVWARSASDIWITNQVGPVLHFDGASWARTELPRGDDSTDAVWGDSSGHVWIGGSRDLILHFDGKTWAKEPVEGGGLSQVRRFVADDTGQLYALADGVLRRDNGTWKRVGALGGVTGLARCGGSLWAAAQRPARLDADGGWTQFGIPHGLSTATAGAVLADGTFVVAGSHLLHRQGAAWQHRLDPLPDTFRALAGRSHDDLWAVGPLGLWRFDGELWKPSGLVTGELSFARAESDGSLLVASPRGEITLVEGDKSTTLASAPTSGLSGDLRGLSWLSRDEAYAASDDTVLRYTRQDGWAQVASSSDIRGIFATESDVWVARKRGLARLVGASLEDVDLGAALSADDDVVTLGGSGASDVWLVTRTKALRFDGKSWAAVDGDNPDRVPSASAVVVSAGPGDSWVVRNSMQYAHHDGSAWSIEPTQEYFADFTCDQGKLVALLGETLSVRRGDGAVFDPPSEQVSQYSVFRSLFVGPDDVWVLSPAADKEVIRHWTGSWSVSVDTVGPHVVGLWAFETGEAWAVSNNQIMHRTPPR